MSEASLKGVIPKKFTPITNRDLSNLAADKAAVAALGQGATNVEMFTIPLYMCAISSLQGTHEINSKGTDYYKGRVWPGMSTTAGKSLTPNQQAYNSIFSVFIQEMLHLQLAANLTAVLGVTPKFFNGTILENKSKGWNCYGPTNSTIPHIIDLKDTTNSASVKVNLDELNSDQIKLFLAIEQPHDLAREHIKPDKLDKYFPDVPFAGWTDKSTEIDLPLFGSIGWMYNSLLKYLTIEYSDGEILWQKMFNPENIKQQRDIFNATSSGHPKAEYPLMFTEVKSADPFLALLEAIDMVEGIIDQGEGGIGDFVSLVREHIKTNCAHKLTKPANKANDVQIVFQPDEEALQVDYPSYNASGKPTGDSADGDARFIGDEVTHWERFDALESLLPSLTTWSQWFAEKHTWTAESLINELYDPAKAPKNIPSPADMAKALNELKSSSKPELSQVVTGAIAGINSVLTSSWGNDGVAFPYPSMAGSGDRMSFYWAVFGEAPDISVGLPSLSPDKLYHACQSLDYTNPNDPSIDLGVYHTCRGSNSCKAQGGCGFAQSIKGGGGCGAMRTTNSKLHSGCGAPTPSDKYTAPNDNKCGSFGGCAVPISASQLYPESGTMVLDDVLGSTEKPLDDIQFKVGDSVYDTAWKAYSTVMNANKKTPGDKPEPDNLRTALPPST